MNISSMGMNFPVQNIQSGNNTPSKIASAASDSNIQSTHQSKAVDMRNVSLNEINALIRSGVDGLLDTMPFISPLIVNQYGAEYAANIKVDFLAQLENSIEFKKSNGEDTAFIEKILDNLKEIDGTKVPAKINISA